MPKGAEQRDHRKACTLCNTLRDVLVRCQIDESGKWHFVCPGSCWKQVSGGVIDGDKTDEHKFYQYGGMWKNKHEAVSAKKPKKKASKEAVETKANDDEAARHAPEAEDDDGGVAVET